MPQSLITSAPIEPVRARASSIFHAELAAGEISGTIRSDGSGHLQYDHPSRFFFNVMLLKSLVREENIKRDNISSFI